MNDAFLSRLRRLMSSRFRSAFNGIKGETQESIQLKAIEKIDVASSEIKHLLGKAEAKRYLATSKLKELKSDDSTLNQEIHITIKDEQYDLSRAAIEKQMVIKSQITDLGNRILELDEEMQEMALYLDNLNAQKKALDVHRCNVDFSVELDDFLEQKKRVIAHDHAKPKELIELDKLAHAAKVDERLADFKEKGNLE